MQIGLSVELLDQGDRLGQQVGLVGERHAHVDVEHVGAALDLGLHVALDRRQVAGAQLLLKDPPPRRVDPLTDQAERAVVSDDDLRARSAQDGLEAFGRHQADTFERFSCSSALARLTVADASAA